MNHCENFIGLRLWIPSQNVSDHVITDQIDMDDHLRVKTDRNQWWNLPIVDGAVPEEFATLK